MIRVVYKHWKKDKQLEVVGTMPPNLNNSISDRFIVLTEDGRHEDVIKSTVIRIEEIKDV